MNKNKDTITVIVAGDPTEVEVNVNAPLHTIKPQALHQTGHVGQPPEEWELRDEQGNLLDGNKKIREFGFTDETRLFMSLGAGVTGGHRFAR
jgi:hypothetical protein